MTAAPAEVLKHRGLADWLRWQQTLHSHAIELGLDRVGEVARRLGLLPFPMPVIAVAGTNGKGSCAMLLAHVLGASSSVGLYTSPHLRRYNERVCIAGNMVTDARLCVAFEVVDQAREDVSLTYFEFGTLAALWLFKQAGVDFAVLEVGMGGRLDAVNIVDADVALITNIGLDHMQWLGDNREQIGFEKAGILRPGQQAVCTDTDMPASILRTATDCGATLHCIGRDFALESRDGNWAWRDWENHCLRLSVLPATQPANVAGVLGVLTCLQRLPTAARLTGRLATFTVPGRCEHRAGTPEIVLDVGHNAEAMQVLANHLAAHPVQGRNLCIIAMLQDKPVEHSSAALAPVVDAAYAAGLPGVDRACDPGQLAQRLPFEARVCRDVATALAGARSEAGPNDRIVICGSFHTVSAALENLDG